nr:L-type lectin-domain containing receptor kinase S.4-like [Tanacetum cinerariifolium]
NDNHVGVNINRMRSINSTRAGYFIDGNSTKNELSLTSGQKIQAWIDYDGEKHEINVTLSVFSKKPMTPIISIIPLDLSEVFHDFMYVGFSASTGHLVSNHYIYGWTFNMSGKSESLDLDHLASLQTFNKTDEKVDDRDGDKGDDKSDKGFVTKLVGSLLLVLFVVLVIIASGVYGVRKLKNIDVVEDWEFDVGPHTFCYKELKDATKSFHDKGLLGFGGSGKVYKGVFPDTGSEIAVKRISRDSKHGPKEFVSEILTVGRLRHRNLVQLLGWCRWKGEFLLVYDFMANGSLDKYIYNNPRMILSWEQRFKIINDVSNGLVYLHEGWEQTVLHRDIKAGNVLLDSEWNGRLGDFGLAKLYDHGSQRAVSQTQGYIVLQPAEKFKYGSVLSDTSYHKPNTPYRQN